MSISRTPPPQSAPDPCSCCGLVEADTELSESSVRGFAGYAGLIGARFSTECWYKCRDYAVFADRIRARRAAPRMYGTQPEVLPETLPAGTRACSLTAPEALVLGIWHGRPCYLLRCAQSGDEGWSWPSEIDWSTVPVEEAEQSRPLTDVARELRDECAPVRGLFTCLFCSSPPMANHDCCVYCRQSIKESGTSYHNEPANVAARARMLAADAREKPRASAESRELALPHPWESESE